MHTSFVNYITIYDSLNSAESTQKYSRSIKIEPLSTFPQSGISCHPQNKIVDTIPKVLNGFLRLPCGMPCLKIHERLVPSFPLSNVIDEAIPLSYLMSICSFMNLLIYL